MLPSCHSLKEVIVTNAGSTPAFSAGGPLRGISRAIFAGTKVRFSSCVRLAEKAEDHTGTLTMHPRQRARPIKAAAFFQMKGGIVV